MCTWNQTQCSTADRYWIVLLALLAMAALSWTAIPAYCQPANDNFVDAEIVTALPFNGTVDIAGSTVETGEPQLCWNPPGTVWYSITPSGTDMALKIDMAGISFYDTAFAVYRDSGGGLPGLQFIGCRSWGESITFLAKAGETYYIQAGSTYSSTGTSQLNIVPIPEPANDNFADATVIGELPFQDAQEAISANLETDEPVPCYGTPDATVWYSYTPEDSGPVSAYVNYPYLNSVAAYTGDALGSLTAIGCVSPANILTLTLQADTTYYFQVGTLNAAEQGVMDFSLYVTPPPVASIGMNSWDPSIFTLIEFRDYSHDPGQVGIKSRFWVFGDGATSEEAYPTHQYAADGDYTVNLTVWTPDGRTSSTTTLVQVRTHDVAITKFMAPSAAATRQTRTITVGINSKRYPETVEVQLMKSVPGYGYQTIGWLTQSVPVRSANRTTVFSFNYTFTSEDAKIGKITFRAVATIVNARDALPGDNEAIALPTKVSR